MTLRLILTRHAKSSWDDPLQEDHDRVLNERGRTAAPAIGAWLQKQGYLPDEVLCSTATRTRETLDRLGLPQAETEYVERLYHASSDTMMDVLKRATGRTVMMIGHNPGIADLATRLLSNTPAHPQFTRYPTCATLVAEFPENEWRAGRFHTARAIDFIVPRDLTD